MTLNNKREYKVFSQNMVIQSIFDGTSAVLFYLSIDFTKLYLFA